MKNNSVTSFEVTGHSLFDSKGKDIICSAVSVLFESSIIALKEVLNLPIHTEKREGYLNCIIPSDIAKDYLDKIDFWFASIIITLKSIENQYPQNIRLKINYR